MNGDLRFPGSPWLTENVPVIGMFSPDKTSSLTSLAKTRLPIGITAPQAIRLMPNSLEPGQVAQRQPKGDQGCVTEVYAVSPMAEPQLPLLSTNSPSNQNAFGDR